MKTASWIILTIVGALTLLGSLGSMSLAYFGQDSSEEFGVGGPKLTEVRAWNPAIAEAIRGRRATAAAYAAAFATLWLAVVLVPYRRGDVWAWWGLLAAALVLAVIIVLRVPFLKTTLGIPGSLMTFGISLVALLFDLKRLRA